MTKDEKSLLIAMSIGDGHVRLQGSQGSQGSLSIQHSIKQRDYLFYKADLISKIFDCKIKISEFNHNGFMQARFEKSNRYFKFIRRWLYPQGIKVISQKILDRLTPHGIAIWYMDDGSLAAKKKNGKIHAYDLTISTYCSEKEVETAIQYFQENHGIKFTKKRNKTKFSIRCGTKEARKFIHLVKDFIIPSMAYKINISY